MRTSSEEIFPGKSFWNSVRMLRKFSVRNEFLRLCCVTILQLMKTAAPLPSSQRSHKGFENYMTCPQLPAFFSPRFSSLFASSGHLVFSSSQLCPPSCSSLGLTMASESFSTLRSYLPTSFSLPAPRTKKFARKKHPRPHSLSSPPPPPHLQQLSFPSPERVEISFYLRR